MCRISKIQGAFRGVQLADFVLQHQPEEVFMPLVAEDSMAAVAEGDKKILTILS